MMGIITKCGEQEKEYGVCGCLERGNRLIFLFEVMMCCIELKDFYQKVNRGNLNAKHFWLFNSICCIFNPFKVFITVCPSWV